VKRRAGSRGRKPPCPVRRMTWRSAASSTASFSTRRCSTSGSASGVGRPSCAAAHRCSPAPVQRVDALQVCDGEGRPVPASRQISFGVGTARCRARRRRVPPRHPRPPRAAGCAPGRQAARVPPTRWRSTSARA
jgi:hypothetical protein